MLLSFESVHCLYFKVNSKGAVEFLPSILQRASKSHIALRILIEIHTISQKFQTSEECKKSSFPDQPILQARRRKQHVAVC